MSGRGRVALLNAHECLRNPPGCPGELPDVRERLKGHLECPGVVGGPLECPGVVGRPSRMCGSG